VPGELPDALRVHTSHAFYHCPQVPGVDTTDTTKRTIPVDLANLTPSTTGPGVTNGCASLRGKFRVTTLTATSRHTGGTDGIFNQADNSVNSYFYLGACLLAPEPPCHGVARSATQTSTGCEQCMVVWLHQDIRGVLLPAVFCCLQATALNSHAALAC